LDAHAADQPYTLTLITGLNVPVSCIWKILERALRHVEQRGEPAIEDDRSDKPFQHYMDLSKNLFLKHAPRYRVGRDKGGLANRSREIDGRSVAWIE
jgi:hypothetical protein